MHHEKTYKILCSEGSSECPLFLLAKVGWRRGKILATEALKVLGREFIWLGSEGKKKNMYCVRAEALYIVEALNLSKLHTKLQFLSHLCIVQCNV